MASALEVLPRGLEGRASVCHVGDLGLNPRLGRSPGEGKGKPSQWKIPWTEEPAKLHGSNPRVCKESHKTEQLYFTMS